MTRLIPPAPRVSALPAAHPEPGTWATYGGLPFIIEGLASRWNASRRWTPEYLKERAGDDVVRTFITDKSLQGTVLQQINKSAELPFREVIDHIYGLRRVDPDIAYYLRVEPGSKTYATLAEDIDIPDIGRSFNPSWSGIWMGQKGNATPFHNDQWHGLLFHITGHKRYVIVHPFDAPRLQQDWPAAPKYDLCRADLVEPADPVLQDLEVCYSGILNPGEVMYVPPFWMHQFVTLDDGNISLPLRFDTTQTPHASLFQLSQQSALRHLTNQPVRDRAKILEFLRTNRGNFRALEREFVAALIDTRGLNETVDGLLNDIDNLRGGA